MADDLDAMVGKLEQLADSLSGGDLRHLNGTVAQAAQRDILAELDADLPGRRFTNWGIVLTVAVEATSDDTSRLIPTPEAPWKVLDVGRSPGSNGRVSWGATRGRGTWQSASDRVAAETPQRVDQQVRDILGRIY
jgi:hypothetical protein